MEGKRRKQPCVPADLLFYTIVPDSDAKCSVVKRAPIKSILYYGRPYGVYRAKRASILQNIASFASQAGRSLILEVRSVILTISDPQKDICFNTLEEIVSLLHSPVSRLAE